MNDSSDLATAEDVGLLLKQTQAVLHQRMDEALRPFGLSVAQYVCLLNLHDEPGITGSELARRAFVSRQSMNVLIQGLESRELVERSREPGPRRERANTLTSRADALLEGAMDEVVGVTGAMTVGLGEQDIDRLARLLSHCREALSGSCLP